MLILQSTGLRACAHQRFRRAVATAGWSPAQARAKIATARQRQGCPSHPWLRTAVEGRTERKRTCEFPGERATPAARVCFPPHGFELYRTTTTKNRQKTCELTGVINQLKNKKRHASSKGFLCAPWLGTIADRKREERNPKEHVSLRER